MVAEPNPLDCCENEATIFQSRYQDPRSSLWGPHVGLAIDETPCADHHMVAIYGCLKPRVFQVISHQSVTILPCLFRPWTPPSPAGGCLDHCSEVAAVRELICLLIHKYKLWTHLRIDVIHINMSVTLYIYIYINISSVLSLHKCTYTICNIYIYTQIYTLPHVRLESSKVYLCWKSYSRWAGLLPRFNGAAVKPCCCGTLVIVLTIDDEPQHILE